MKELWDSFVASLTATYLDFSNPLAICKTVTNYILLLFSILLFYRFIYILVGFFGKAPKYEKAPFDKKYACVIAARNEEKVIGNLIDSIKKQTYDQDKITVFVIADNCTDDGRTASIAKEHGAVVYERFDKEHVSKGYAIEFLMENLKKDYGIESFDYYLIFDADNLLNPKFIEEMNNCFATGYDAVVSFRNIKNFGTNIISAGYGMHFYRNTLINHRPRAILNTPTNVTGTGYGVKSCHLVDGWHFTNLTEDLEFTTVSIANNLRIGYCEAAEIYDEQPTSLKVSWRQRLRWRKGGLLNYVHNSPKLFVNIFKSKSWGSYDMYWHTFPYDLFSFFLAIALQVFGMVYSFATTGTYDPTSFFKYLLGIFTSAYIAAFFMGFLIVFKERKRIHCGFWKLVLYLFTWPLFDTISIIIAVQCLFMKIKWKPIEHDDSTSIDELMTKEDSIR